MITGVLVKTKKSCVVVKEKKTNILCNQNVSTLRMRDGIRDWISWSFSEQFLTSADIPAFYDSSTRCAQARPESSFLLLFLLITALGSFSLS